VRYAPLAEIDFAEARRSFDEHFWLALHVARTPSGRVRAGGTLLFVSGTGGRRPQLRPGLLVPTGKALGEGCDHPLKIANICSPPQDLPRTARPKPRPKADSDN